MNTISLRALPLALAAALLFSLGGCGQAAPQTTSQAASQTAFENGSPQAADQSQVRELALSSQGVTLDGQTVAEGKDGAVTVSHDIIYYQAGQGSDYGEGTAQEEHTPEQAAAHTVVTIREPGTYRVSGQLPQGQLAVDLGEDAEDDPEAVAILILDGADVTCTVAPAFMAYRAYECGDKDGDSPVVDTSGAGIRVVLADGSENNFTGSHVARIYEEGTTDKLHKYDGAFYSKVSMSIAGETQGTGILNIVGDNEGLDTELHLTIEGGNINIRAQDDGINTNEDGVSVTTINGGTLRVEGGLGAEGDGIDSNGHLVINGGSVYALSNERSPDGGLDADGQILLNGGTVVALGTRNDAASADSTQEYLELSFASTLPAGSQLALSGPDGETLFSLTTEKAAQSVTLSSPALQQGVAYTLTVDGVTQSYTGHRAGGFPGGGPGGRPGGFPGRGDVPEGLEDWLSTAQDVPDDIRAWLEEIAAQQRDLPQPPQEGGQPPQGFPGDGGEAGGGEPSTQFLLEEGVHTFSGITDSAQDSGRTQVSFTADLIVDGEGAVSLSHIQADQAVEDSHVQLTITDVPSEDYAASCLLSEGEEAIAAILPTAPGNYLLTIAVSGDSSYAGSSQFPFTTPG